MAILRLLPAALLLLAATACAGPAEPQPAATSSPAGEAITDATVPEPPVKPPRMADEPPPRRMPGSDATLEQCDATAARGAIGAVATAEVVEQARVAAGANVVRTLKPGQVVTMEYHASRLTLHVDEANVVVDVRCG